MRIVLKPGGNISLGIRAPEYFPRLDYFVLMDRCDVFVVADTFQYSRQSYQNRTEIRTPTGRHWLSIPLVSGQHGVAIRDARVSGDEQHWRRNHWRSLVFNYRSTPYFDFLESDVRNAMAMQSPLLCEYTIPSILCIVRMLELRTKVVLASELGQGLSTARAIAKKVGPRRLQALADTVVTVSAEDYDVARVVPTIQPYRQNFDGFEAGLSALDAIMNIGPSATRRLIRARSDIDVISKARTDESARAHYKH